MTRQRTPSLGAGIRPSSGASAEGVITSRDESPLIGTGVAGSGRRGLWSSCSAARFDHSGCIASQLGELLFRDAPSRLRPSPSGPVARLALNSGCRLLRPSRHVRLTATMEYCPAHCRAIHSRQEVAIPLDFAEEGLTARVRRRRVFGIRLFPCSLALIGLRSDRGT